MSARRPLLLTSAVALTLVAASPSPARADIGVGLFVGEPTGVTVKIGLERRTALELLGGWNTWDDGRGAYGHITFLAQLFAARGSSVIVPFRLGIGGAVYDAGPDDIGVAARAPLQIAFVFTGAPVELYGELALRLQAVPDGDVDLDGGLGFRIYF